MSKAPIGLHHDHIDGSRAVYGIITDLYTLAEKPFPFLKEDGSPDKDAWLRYFNDPQEDIVEKFATITGVLQSAEALKMLGFAYANHRADEGVIYAEAKFAPQYLTLGGLTMEEAAKALIEGLRDGETSNMIRIHPVLCIGRETNRGTGIDIAKIALEYDGEVAIDLVCDEAAHPPEKHLEAYRLTKGTKVRRDCHAGEWVAKEPDATYRQRLLKNVRTAVRMLEVDGLGHAIPLADDPELVKEVVDRGIRVSWCPMSNIATGGIQDVRDLKIDALLDAGVIGTINPDDDLFMPDVHEVRAICQEKYDFSQKHRDLLFANQFRGAFSEYARKTFSQLRSVIPPPSIPPRV
jgi:adenosine deaminase